MTADVAEFLAKQERYRCERLCADLTVQQCEQNRSRNKEYGKPGLSAIISCEDCPGLGQLVKLAQKIEGEEMPKTCEKINCSQPVRAKGLCQKHYDEKRFQEKKVAEKPAAEVKAVTAAAGVDQYPLKTLLPVVSQPIAAMVLTLPDDLSERVRHFGLTADVLIDCLDALVHGELERHTYRRQP